MSFTPSHRGGDGPPLVLLHGFCDSWRTWDLVRPTLEQHFTVFSPTLPGHAGGPELATPSEAAMIDGVERILDEAEIGEAHIAGNSLGGLISLALAARGRATTVTALAPAGGWPPGDPTERARAAHFTQLLELAPLAAPHADAIAATPEGRRRATEQIAVNHEHIPADLIAHQIRAVAAATAAPALLERGIAADWELDAEAIACPVQIVWGTADAILPYPATAVRYQEQWLPAAHWEVLDGVGHCPQLDVPSVTSELIRSFAL